MHETCKLAGLATFQVGRSGEPPPVNAAIDKLASCEAVKRLVGAENQILIYAGLASVGLSYCATVRFCWLYSEVAMARCERQLMRQTRHPDAAREWQLQPEIGHSGNSL
jgi:hypothetical protein